MHTPCPTPSLITKTNRGLRNTLHNPGMHSARYAFEQCVHTLLGKSLIHRFDEFHRCASAIVTILARSKLLRSRFSASSVSSSSSSSSSFTCLLSLPLSGQSKPTVRVVHLRTTNFQLFLLEQLVSARDPWLLNLDWRVILSWDFLTCGLYVYNMIYGWLYNM